MEDEIRQNLKKVLDYFSKDNVYSRKMRKVLEKAGFKTITSLSYLAGYFYLKTIDSIDAYRWLMSQAGGRDDFIKEILNNNDLFKLLEVIVDEYLEKEFKNEFKTISQKFKRRQE